MICVCGKSCENYKQCFTCMAKTRDKCRCGKYKDKKYDKCYTCKSCNVCGGSGRMYLSEDTYCSCECTGKPFDDIY